MSGVDPRGAGDWVIGDAEPASRAQQEGSCPVCGHKVLSRAYPCAGCGHRFPDAAPASAPTDAGTERLTRDVGLVAAAMQLGWILVGGACGLVAWHLWTSGKGAGRPAAGGLAAELAVAAVLLTSIVLGRRFRTWGLASLAGMALTVVFVLSATRTGEAGAWLMGTGWGVVTVAMALRFVGEGGPLEAVGRLVCLTLGVGYLIVALAQVAVGASQPDARWADAWGTVCFAGLCLFLAYITRETVERWAESRRVRDEEGGFGLRFWS